MCLARIDDHCQAGYEDSPRAGHKRVCSSTGARVTAADTPISPSRNSAFPDYGTCEKELADEGVDGCCLERRSFVGAHKLALQKTTVLRKYRVMCHRVGRRQLSAYEHGFRRRHHSDLLSLSTNCNFRRCEVVFGGHMESNFDAFDETSMCMSTACDVHSSGGFDASGRNVHRILDLWKIHRKCCKTRLLKPLHKFSVCDSSVLPLCPGEIRCAVLELGIKVAVQRVPTERSPLICAENWRGNVFPRR